MKRINLNTLAKRIAEREGKKKQVNVAQIKEILRIALDEMSDGEFAVVRWNSVHDSCEVWA